MTAEVFIDTNILLYACSSAPSDTDKRKRAEELPLNTRFGLSAQVLQEFIANALRKKSLGISEDGIDATVSLGTLVPVQPVTLEVVLSGISLRRRYKLSHWDATIVAAAQTLGCRILYSEDLSHGQRFDSLQVINPFL